MKRAVTRGGGAEPVVQLTHQIPLEQGDHQGVAAEQGDDEQQQGDRQQPAAQREPAARPARRARAHGRGLRST